MRKQVCNKQMKLNEKKKKKRLWKKKPLNNSQH